MLKAIRLSPMPSNLWYVFLSSALLNAGRYEEAVTAFRKAATLSPNNMFAHLALVLSYSLGRRDEEARSEAAGVLRIQPKFSLDKFGKRVSYGRFTNHPVDDVKNRLVLGILNFEPRQIGPVASEVLILGVQYPKAESGEATFVSPVANAKIGTKLF